jgi:hypothetical protein
MAPRSGQLLGVDLGDISWHTSVRSGVGRKELAPGTTPKPLTVPQAQANKLLGSIVRVVADIPRGASPEVVWTQGSDELLVDTRSIGLVCTNGLVRVSLAVDCDQLATPAKVTVPLAVGSPAQPNGLIMSSFTRIDAPGEIVHIWSEAITAFAWEALLELAAQLCAEVGKDGRGRPLIPVDISASNKHLIVTPMARHDVTRSTVTRNTVTRNTVTRNSR